MDIIKFLNKEPKLGPIIPVLKIICSAWIRDKQRVFAHVLVMF